MTRSDTQSSQILSWLKRGRSITPIDALNRFGVFRLAARVADLRKDGHPIQTKIVYAGDKHFARYSLPRRKVA
jgi:hypothetical protein